MGGDNVIPTTFIALLQEIQTTLVGKNLRSISGKSNITLKSINPITGDFVVTTKNGVDKPRPGTMLRSYWDDLQSQPAVHSDITSGGSRSSRSHPETILANLPFVEWLKIDNRKHITLRKNRTHAAGTIKEMAGANADKIRAKMGLALV